MAEKKFNFTDLITAFNAARQTLDLIRGYITTAKENSEMTSEEEAAWAKSLADYRASPAGTPTPAGKL